MTLFARDGFDATLGAWPGVTFEDQWESHIAKVGGKVFCLLGDQSNALVFKVTEMSFDLLTELEGVGQAAYFAKRKWVRVEPHAPLSAEEVVAYARQSYGLVAQGLTRKLRTELGITIDVREI